MQSLICAFLGMVRAHSTQGVKDNRGETSGLVYPLIASFLESTPPHTHQLYFILFFCYSWGRVGGIDSDSPHTLRGSDSSQLWCSSNSVQNTVGALPQLPRSSQTRSDVLASALNDTKFISKLDTHTRIRDSPATNRA